VKTCHSSSWKIPHSLVWNIVKSASLPSSNEFSNFFVSLGLTFLIGRRLQIWRNLGLQYPPFPYGFRHIGHEMWTSFLNSPHSHLLSRSENMLSLNTGFWPIRIWGLTSYSLTFSPQLQSLSTSYSSDGLVAQLTVKFKVKVTLRPTVSQPVSLGVRPPSGNRDQFFSLWDYL
jgi:hypothetical protein